MPSIRAWNPIATLKGHQKNIWYCAWSPDSRRIASASDDSMLRIWDARLWREEVRLQTPDMLNCCAWSPDGLWVVAGSDDKALIVWEAGTWIKAATLRGHTNRIWACAWSPSSRWMASGSDDKTLRLWDMRTGKEVGVLNGHKNYVWGCAWSPDEKWIVSASVDETLIIWDAKRLFKVATLDGHKDAVNCCSWSYDGRWIASASYDYTVKVWSARTWKEVTTLIGHKDYVNSCAWSPDGRWVISASADATLKIWDAKTWKEAATLEGIIGGTESCAWSPDGRWIVSASDDFTLKVWDASAITKALLSNVPPRTVRGNLRGMGGASIAAADLYRKAVRLLGEGDIDNGIKHLEDAAAIDPNDAMIRKRLRAAKQKLGTLSPDSAITKPAPLPQSGSLEIPTNIIDRVHLTVTSPPAVQPGDSFVIYIWAHLEQHRDEIIERALSSSGGIEVGSKGPLQVARGTVLSVRLNVEGLIDNQQDTILWDGEIGNANFLASVPDDAREGARKGLALIYANELQIARINFVIHIGKVSMDAAPLPTQEHRHRKAFASYSSADCDDVLARIQGMLKAAPELDVFVDVVSLRSGQYWEQELFKVIPVNDIFYLFWSESAKKSEWVEKEWRCALNTRGLDFIDPVPLVSPDAVPPPLELANKHFNDWTLAFMRSRGSKT